MHGPTSIAAKQFQHTQPRGQPPPRLEASAPQLLHIWGQLRLACIMAGQHRHGAVRVVYRHVTRCIAAATRGRGSARLARGAAARPGKDAESATARQSCARALGAVRAWALAAAGCRGVARAHGGAAAGRCAGSGARCQGARVVCPAACRSADGGICFKAGAGWR